MAWGSRGATLGANQTIDSSSRRWAEESHSLISMATGCWISSLSMAAKRLEVRVLNQFGTPFIATWETVALRTWLEEPGLIGLPSTGWGWPSQTMITTASKMSS